jgi:hypothetical protein
MEKYLVIIHEYNKEVSLWEKCLTLLYLVYCCVLL